MTLPGGSDPSFFDLGDYGITGGTAGSISGMKNRTRTNIENEYKNQLKTDSPWKTWSDQFFQGLEGILGFPAAILKAISEAMGGVSFGGVTGIEDLLDAVNAFFGGKWETLTEHTEAIADLETISAAMRTTQAYVGDLQDMVSVPRCLLSTIAPTGYKCWNVSDPIGIALYGLLSSDVLPVIYPRVYFGVTKGDIYYTPIVVDRFGTIDKLRWIVGADSSIFSIDYYEVALCVYNPANGNVEKVWGSGNVVDTTANTSTLKEVEVSMGLSQNITPGQILFVAHQQVGPGIGQSPRAFASAPQGRIGRPTSLLLDAACYRANDYTQGIPSSISLASLTREDGFIPWAAVSVNS